MDCKKYTIIIISSTILKLMLMSGGAWYDEFFTLALANLPIPNLIAATMADVHPPLYYLLARLAVVLFGSSPVAARAPA